MAGYQFIHYEAYARTGNDKKRSLVSIAKEADRDSGNHPHVTAPLPPEYLLGTSFVEAVEAIVAATDASKVNHSGKKRNVRKDANVGIGLIASHPVSIDDLNAMAEPERIKTISIIKEWAEDTVTFAETEFPGLAQVAALHWDESHPHIHVLIGSTEPTDDFEIIHKGEQARKSAQGNDRTGRGKKLGNDAYTKEMRRFQDKYYDEVAIFYGQARFGPKRRRKSRAEWRKEQAQLDCVAKSLQRGKSVDHQVEIALSAATDQAQHIIDTTQEEAARQRKLAEQQAQLAEQELAKAERFKKKVEIDAKEVAELKVLTERMREHLGERVRKISRYDGIFGRLLGWLGIKKRIEREAITVAAKRIASMKQQIDKLQAQVGCDNAIKKQHDSALGALKALQAALSVSVESYPSLSDKGALNDHFEHIQKIMDMNLTSDGIIDELGEHMSSLKLRQIEWRSSRHMKLSALDL